MRTPRRVTLVEQTADILRQDLREGRWLDRLPGEHDLSDQLQVGRSTLRAALCVLRMEGLIRMSPGRRHQLTPASRRPKAKPSKKIGLVLGLSLSAQMARSIVVVDELRRYLQQKGFELVVLSEPLKHWDPRHLKLMVQQTRADCWVLASCSMQLQRWFAGNPWLSLVHGSPYEGIDLPVFKLDVGAACQHAIGMLHSRGHRSIGLLLRAPLSAGAVEVEQCFRHFCANCREMNLTLQIKYHDGSVDSIERIVSKCLKLEAAPSAFLVMAPTDALTIYCHILNYGLRVPRDISLVSLFDDLFLASMTPPLTRYTYKLSTFVRRLTRLVIKMAILQTRPPSISIVPDFVPGATVGPPRMANNG